MLKRSSLVATCIVCLAAIVGAQTSPKPLTNADLIVMFKGGLGESTIVSAIQSQDTDFDISATGLLQLKKGGVPPKVMDAVIGAVGRKKAASDTAAAAAAKSEAEAKLKAGPLVPAAMLSPIPGQPSVVMVQGGLKQLIPLAHTQIVQTKTKPSTLGALATDGGLAQAMSGMSQSVAAAGAMKGSSKIASTAMMANPMVGGVLMAGSFLGHRKQTVTDVWAVPGLKSETLIHNTQPTFEVHFDNIPGVNPEDYQPILLKLESTPNNYRLVGATEAKPDTLQSSTTDWGMYSSFVEELAPGKANKVAVGNFQLQVSSALAPGEYAVVLRPTNKDKKFSGGSISQNTGDGLIFNSIWSFEVAE